MMKSNGLGKQTRVASPPPRRFSLFSFREPSHALNSLPDPSLAGERHDEGNPICCGNWIGGFRRVGGSLLNQAHTVAGPASLTQEVRVICEANGVCYRPPGRPLVAEWVYGDGAFYGPSVGPGNYGRPGKHYNMTPSWFLWWKLTTAGPTRSRGRAVRRAGSVSG
jgi:hypothetical protein